MHREAFSIPPTTRRAIEKNWGSLFAVGTTSLRALESLGDSEGRFKGAESMEEVLETELFIYPGKSIHSIRGLVTNFHLPKSSLFILVCALVGRKKALDLYQLAKEKSYRFLVTGMGCWC